MNKAHIIINTLRTLVDIITCSKYTLPKEEIPLSRGEPYNVLTRLMNELSHSRSITEQTHKPSTQKLSFYPSRFSLIL